MSLFKKRLPLGAIIIVKFLKKYCLLLLVAVTFCFGSTTHALADESAPKANSGLSIAPIIQELEGMPGKNYSLEYTIDNGVASNVEVDMSVETFEEGSLQGSANVVPFPADKDYSNWLNIPTVQTFVGNNQSKTTYVASIPEKTPSGAYLFAIIYKPKNQEQKPSTDKNILIIQSRIASLLFVNVGGDKSKKPEINNFKTNSTWIDPFFDNLELKYDVDVKGSSFYRPMGNIFLEQPDSDKINTLASITSDKLILPNRSRNYIYCLKSLISRQGCKENELPNAKLPWYGNAALALRLDYTDGSGGPQSAVSKKNVIIFPYKTALGLLFICGIVLLVIMKLVKPKNIYVQKTAD